MSPNNTPSALTSIKFLSDPLSGKTFSIKKPVTAIGRNEGNDIVITVVRKVSRQHARLMWSSGSRIIRIVLQGNRRGRTLNSLLYQGCKILGDESYVIRTEIHNLKKCCNNNVTLLNNISICFPPRTFVALVGGSGIGKSTLMDAPNGLRPAHVGKVLYNGRDYYYHLAAFSTQIGYVPQDDIVHRDLTVGLGILPYVFSKIAVLGAFALFQSAAILLIVHLFEPLQTSIFLPVLLGMYITLELTALGSLLVGLAASAFAANEDTANSLPPFLLIFAGTEIPLNSQAAMHRVALAWGILDAIIVALIIVICIGLKRKDVRR